MKACKVRKKIRHVRHAKKMKACKTRKKKEDIRG